MVVAHLVWLVLVCLLGAWWGRLVLSQAKKIAELERLIGMSAVVTEGNWNKTQRMLYWESFTFFALLLASTSLLFWLYWRDLKRARGIQAFFASVTHELRTPLTSIRLQAESIADNLSGENSQKDLVQRLLEDSIRLEAQVERTLELARVEGGGPVYLQALQLKPWLERFIKSWQLDYSEKIQFLCDLDDLWVEADPTALQVIFKNLFENSVRHSKKERVQVRIKAERDSQRIRILIQDDGLGFSGKQNTLGLLFHKGVASQGTGVGLYLVRVLVERMGGRVFFDSNPGFQVSLWLSEGRANG
jgi:signal transduction histidine kinase